MIRRRCIRHGHRWVVYLEAFRIPFQFCSRWRCDASRPDPMLPADQRAKMAVWLTMHEPPG